MYRPPSMAEVLGLTDRLQMAMVERKSYASSLNATDIAEGLRSPKDTNPTDPTTKMEKPIATRCVRK